MDTVDVDIAPGRAAQGLECVLTLRGLCVPDLDSSVTRGAAMKFSLERLLTNIHPRPEHLVAIRGVCDTIDIAGVTSELFQRFPALQSVYSNCHVKTGRQQLKVFHVMNKKL